MGPIAEFYKQHVRPHLLWSKKAVTQRDNIDYAFWVKSRGGGAMSSKQLSRIIGKVYTKFNPYLQITPLEFRRNTITDIFAGKS